MIYCKFKRIAADEFELLQIRISRLHIQTKNICIEIETIVILRMASLLNIHSNA